VVAARRRWASAIWQPCALTASLLLGLQHLQDLADHLLGGQLLTLPHLDQLAIVLPFSLDSI
jgi:hypothetical protein